MNKTTKGKSFRARLLQICILVVLLPITVVSFAFGINSTRIIRSGMEELAASDMVRTQTSIDDWITSYQDVLYQLFTDEEIITLTEKLDNQQDQAVTRSQLRRKLAEYLYAKDHIKSITIISDGGEVVFYDSLVTSNQKNSWMPFLDMGQEELYNLLAGDNAIHFIPTSPAGNFAGKENYLFHMGRRIINYQDVTAHYGVVILSVDEAMLRGLCTAGNSNPERLDNFYFLVDGDGRVLSYPDKAYLTRELPVEGLSQDGRKQVYRDFALETGLASPDYAAVRVGRNTEFHWDVVQVSNGSQLESRLLQQTIFMFVILMVALCLLVISLWLATGNLSRSVRQIVGVMEQVQEGKMFERVQLRVRELLRGPDAPSVTFGWLTAENLGQVHGQFQRLLECQDFPISQPDCGLVEAWWVGCVAQHPFPGTETLEKQMRSAISALDYEQISGTYEKFTAILSGGEVYTPKSVKNAYVGMLWCVLSSGKDAQVPGMEAFHYPELLDQTLHANNRQDVKKGIEALLQVLKDQTRTRERELSPMIRRADMIIREEYKQGLTLDELAERLRVTPEYLSAQFHREMGATFGTYIRDIRMEQAKKLLLHTDKKLYEIAGEVGYADPKYFSRVFREQTGMLPADYRKVHK